MRRDDVRLRAVYRLDRDVHAERAPMRRALCRRSVGAPHRSGQRERPLHGAAFRLESEVDVVQYTQRAVELWPPRIEMYLEPLAARSRHCPVHITYPAAVHLQLAVRRLECLVLKPSTQ
eukprot:7694-Prymnesium_polylepis.2